MRYNATFNVILVAAMGSSGLLFHFQDAVTKFVSSQDVCDAPISNILQWVFPKLIFRCNLLEDIQIREYPGIEVMIVLDLWLLLCCVVGFACCLLKARSITENDLVNYWYQAKANKRGVQHANSYWSCALVIFLACVFVYSPVIGDGDAFGFIALLSKHGVGAVIHGLFAVGPSYALLTIIVGRAALRKFSMTAS